MQKKCENCAAPSNVPKMTTSISKLKRKLDSNTQSPAAAQTKQARVASCDKLASHPAEVCHPKLHMVTFYCFLPKMLCLCVSSLKLLNGFSDFYYSGSTLEVVEKI